MPHRACRAAADVGRCASHAFGRPQHVSCSRDVRRYGPAVCGDRASIKHKRGTPMAHGTNGSPGELASVSLHAALGCSGCRPRPAPMWTSLVIEASLSRPMTIASLRSSSPSTTVWAIAVPKRSGRARQSRGAEGPRGTDYRGAVGGAVNYRGCFVRARRRRASSANAG
jgi:hypothetical protein